MDNPYTVCVQMKNGKKPVHTKLASFPDRKSSMDFFHNIQGIGNKKNERERIMQICTEGWSSIR